MLLLQTWTTVNNVAFHVPGVLDAKRCDLDRNINGSDDLGRNADCPHRDKEINLHAPALMKSIGPNLRL